MECREIEPFLTFKLMENCVIPCCYRMPKEHALGDGTHIFFECVQARANGQSFLVYAQNSKFGLQLCSEGELVSGVSPAFKRLAQVYPASG